MNIKKNTKDVWDNSISLEITTKIGCSNFCKYCPQDVLIKSYSERSNIFFLSFENFSKILAKIPKKVDILFSGFCESFLNKDCFRMIELASKKGHVVTLNTTLMGMDIGDAKKIKNNLVEYFLIHLPNEKGDEKIIVDERYLQVLQTLLKNKIDIKFISFGNPNKRVEEILNYWRIPKKEYVVKVENLNQRAGNLSPYISLNKGCKKLICSTERLKKNVLLPNGDVVLCCMDYCLKHTLGNLLKQNYDELFMGKEFIKLNHKLERGGEGTLCKSCHMGIYLNSKEFYRFRLDKLAGPIKRTIRNYAKQTTFGRRLLRLNRSLFQKK